MIVDKCTELTDLILHDTALSFHSIDYICTNVTHKLRRLDLSCEKVMDDHILTLFLNACEQYKYVQ